MSIYHPKSKNIWRRWGVGSNLALQVITCLENKPYDGFTIKERAKEYAKDIPYSPTTIYQAITRLSSAGVIREEERGKYITVDYSCPAVEKLLEKKIGPKHSRPSNGHEGLKHEKYNSPLDEYEVFAQHKISGNAALLIVKEIMKNPLDGASSIEERAKYYSERIPYSYRTITMTIYTLRGTGALIYDIENLKLAVNHESPIVEALLTNSDKLLNMMSKKRRMVLEKLREQITEVETSLEVPPQEVSNGWVKTTIPFEVLGKTAMLQAWVKLDFNG